MSFGKIASIVLAVSLATACSQKTPEEYIAEGESAIYAKQPDKAIIVLKNALREEPNNLQARFLLGKVYYNKGNAPYAEKELKTAFEGGYFVNEVLPVYLATLNLMGEYETMVKTVDSVSGLSSQAEAAAQAYKALALYRTDERTRASLALKKANELMPESSYVLFSRANFAIIENEPGDAAALLEQLLANEPEFYDAIVLLGQLKMRSQDYTVAEELFRKYIDFRPGDAQGNVLLAETLVQSEQYDKAEALITDLLKKLPNSPMLNQLMGIVRFQKNDYVGAKTFMETAINAGSNAIPVRLIGGFSAYQLRQYEQAYNHLNSIQQYLPNTHPAKRLLAELQLRLGYTEGAVATLGSLPDVNLNDISLFTQASYDLIRQGDDRKAAQMLNVVRDFNPSDVEEKIRMGLLKLSLNDKSGLADLQAAMESDPSSAQARIALANAYYDEGQAENAIEIAKTWVDEEPENVAAQNLLASLYVKNGQNDLAVQTYQSALAIAQNNPASLKFLADAAVERGDIPQAIKYMKQLVEKNPSFIQGLYDYYLLEKQYGDPSYAVSLIEKNFNANPTDLMAKLNFARILLLENEPQKVVDLLTTIEAQEGLPVLYWKGLADSYVLLANPEEAIRVYQQWQTLEPNSRDPWVHTIALQDWLRDYSSGLDTVKRALKYFQEDKMFLVMEAHFSLMSGNASVAKRLVARLPDSVQDNPLVKGLKGQLLYTEGKFSQAIPLLKDNYNQTRSPMYALLIANSYRNNGQPEQGQAFLESHLEKQPGDINIRARLAERYMNMDVNKAIEQYEISLRILPENIAFINNLAYLYGEVGKLDKALPLAEKGVELRPNLPMMLDTYATLLLKDGQVDKAIAMAKRAFEGDRENKTYLLNYEKALAAKE